VEWVKKRTDIQSADSKVGWTRIKFDVTSQEKKSKKKGATAVQSARTGEQEEERRWCAG